LPGVDAEVRSFLGVAAPQELRFADACEALAAAIKAGHVPAQGQDVLRTLLVKRNVIATSSSLHQALGIPLTDPSEQSAQQLFRFVSGVMNNVFAQGEVASYSEAVRVWVPGSDECTFRQACDALALAIKGGKVPERSVEILKVLHMTCTAKLGDQLGCALRTTSMELETDAESVDVDEHSDKASEILQESNGNTLDDAAISQSWTDASPQSVSSRVCLEF